MKLTPITDALRVVFLNNIGHEAQEPLSAQQRAQFAAELRFRCNKTPEEMAWHSRYLENLTENVRQLFVAKGIQSSSPSGDDSEGLSQETAVPTAESSPHGDPLVVATQDAAVVTVPTAAEDAPKEATNIASDTETQAEETQAEETRAEDAPKEATDIASDTETPAEETRAEETVLEIAPQGDTPKKKGK